MREASKRLHYGQEAWVVELEAWCSASTGGDRGLAQACQLPTIDVRLEHVLLNGQVAVVDPAHHSCRCLSVMPPTGTLNGRRSCPSAACRTARPPLKP